MSGIGFKIASTATGGHAIERNGMMAMLFYPDSDWHDCRDDINPDSDQLIETAISGKGSRINLGTAIGG